ncbi:HEXXH motif-containing putative peptide modification protein [Chitinophaga pinensis]|uniref:HEXXH motif domain-containing protein n=1 Tax=Chitinophaga pinensis (strain ATCC 43595 / DSM 2588 / LMG 13176 / NBRC 15968 / NCIMB 11800 / UQM 2034) TaxID=485918 RepID=A0A979G0U4_CHIPD|nr:HEXXH motif-containing putative peptide modification protein [Chitinophaga pinensis]ACU58764.1 hypothetical protein Cpin_1266 [Chitinophaga pinensis DSM 2588]
MLPLNITRRPDQSTDFIDDLRLQDKLEELAQTIKILVYKEDENIISLLDINDDDIFLEPLLFAWFNNATAPNRPSLEQILFGYISEEQRPNSFTATFDPHGIAYLPKMGSICLTGATHVETAQVRYRGGTTFEVRHGDTLLPHTFVPLQMVGGFELLPFNHPLFYKYFVPVREDAVVDASAIDTYNISVLQRDNLERALKLIEAHCPAFYRMSCMTNRKIVIFNSEPVNSFATKELQGTVFLNANANSNIAFFLDDLIHQWSHNMLNAYMFNMDEYFVINPELKLLSDYSGITADKRNIYDAFHGIFTVAQRVKCFDVLFRLKDAFSREERHELIARYCDQSRRYKTGMQTVVFSEVYTDAGENLYTSLHEGIEHTLENIRHILDRADFSNQVSRFSYPNFCLLNDYSITSE